MSSPDLMRLAAAFAAAFLAGGINSVAGGGTMVSFPVLVGLGLPGVIANATSTVGIWPGSVGSMWGFRAELARVPRPVLLLLVPGALGGALGACLLRVTPAHTFDVLVPVLLFFATALFMVQGPVQRRLQTTRTIKSSGAGWFYVAIPAQLVVGVYGGYFGAGMSIMNLSILGMLGMTDILEMNALTSAMSLVINGVAGALFITAGLVSWPFALAMTTGALAGGYGAAGVARRVGKAAVRRFVIAVGLTLAAVMAWRLFR
jgi:uncharacterized membrane protein YfcA